MTNAKNRPESVDVALEELMPLIRECMAKGQSVRFYPHGVSMLPMLRPGKDSVLLSPAPKVLKKYDLVLFQRRNGTYALHRIARAGQTYALVGDNQTRLEWGIRREQVIAIVSAYYRGEKKHAVSQRGYRLYCRIWPAVRRLRRYARAAKRRIHQYMKRWKQ